VKSEDPSSGETGEASEERKLLLGEKARRW